MKITVTDVPTTIELDVATTIFEVANTGSSTVYRGWEAATTAAGDTQGVPLKADQAIVYGGRDAGVHRGRLHLVCASGETTTVNYSAKT